MTRPHRAGGVSAGACQPPQSFRAFFPFLKRAILATTFLCGWPILGPAAAPAACQVVAVLEVRIQNRATGDPIPSADVAIQETGTVGITDTRGVVLFRGIPPGSYRLQVSALGYENGTGTATALNGRTTRVRILLTAAPLDLPGMEVVARGSRLPAGGIQVTTTDLPPGVRDLPGALEEVPGVTVVRRGGPGAPAGIQLRGTGSDQVLVLLDGVPLNSALTGEVDLSTVDLNSLDRIVVLPGARTARYGPRALGGVVLLETGSSQGSSMDLFLGAGAWGERTVAADVDWVASPRWSASFGSRSTRGEGDFTYEVPEFRGGGEARRENSSYRSESGRVGLSRQWERGEADIRVHLSRTDRGSPGTVAQPSLQARQEHLRWGTSLTAEHEAEGGGASILLGIQSQRTEYRDPEPPFGQPYDQSARVTQRELSAQFWRGAGPLALSAGGEFRRMQIRSGADNLPSSAIGEGGLWGRGAWGRPLATGLQVDLQGGIRLDRHDLVDGLIPSPSFLLTLGGGPTRLEIAYRNGFSPPGISDLFFQEGVLARPNPNLKPERVRGEVSATLAQRVQIGPVSVDVQASFYDADIDDMIFWFPDFQFVWRPQNMDVDRRGVEALASLEVLVRDRPLTLSGKVETSRVTYRGGVLKGQVVYRPRVTADIRARWSLGEVEATLSASHTGSRRTVAGSAINALHPYTILDWGMTVPLPLLPFPGARGRIDLAISNLLDKRPSLLADYPLPGRGWSIGLTFQPAGLP